ncbi:hypothetical protein [Aliihoeflea sp. PC F10.4]
MMKARLPIYALFAFMLTTRDSFAYIDPGTGSVVTTAIIGFFAAAAYTLRRYYYRITDFFSGKNADKEKAKSAEKSSGSR